LLNGLSYIAARGRIRWPQKEAESESESLLFVRSKYANCTPVLGSQLKKIVDAHQQPALITSEALKHPQKLQSKHGSTNISSMFGGFLCWTNQMQDPASTLPCLKVWPSEIWAHHPGSNRHSHSWSIGSGDATRTHAVTE